MLNLPFRYCLFFFLLTAYSGQKNAQTILNAYAKVTAVTGSSVLSLSNLNTSNHTFTVGGQVIIMQMQDDVIGTNTTNVSTFGNLSSIASAGNYEVATIAAANPTNGSPTSVTLTGVLTNSYNFGANSSVQLISFRDLGSNFTTTSNITGLSWNGNVGGVIALYASNVLTLNHRILADGLGFRGGAVSSNASGDFACSNSTYISTLTTLGYKGEGIYLNTNSNFLTGRGRILNGGGGGAQNNAGGGGGGNFTAGGDGGLGYPCTTANSGRGLGGISLSAQITSTRVFMGGGGGGGQANNSVSTSGGDGGGIILIKTSTLATSTSCGSSIRISANGVNAANSGNDGAGGGGGAGSIVIQAGTFSINGACPILIRANGGDGGSVGNAAAHGGGAGGGQGVVIYTIVQPSSNVTTQTNNGTPGSDNSGGTTNATGGTGTSGSGIIGSAPGPLPVELVEFTGEPAGQKTLIKWSTASEFRSHYFILEKSIDAVTFLEIEKITAAGTSTQKNNYEAVDTDPYEGITYYRLTEVDKDGAEKVYPIIFVDFKKQVLDVVIYPNPLSDFENIKVRLNNGYARKSILTLYNAMGAEVFIMPVVNDATPEIEIPSQHLEKGLYFLRITSPLGTNTQRILVE